jgi:predicted nucleic acid-binding protein
MQFGWATCPVTQNGMIRIMSQRSYPSASTTRDMTLRLREATAQPTYTFICDTLSFTDASRVHADGLLTAANTTDIYLLALAVAHNARFVTFDHRVSLRAVLDATAEHIVTR